MIKYKVSKVTEHSTKPHRSAALLYQQHTGKDKDMFSKSILCNYTKMCKCLDATLAEGASTSAENRGNCRGRPTEEGLDGRRLRARRGLPADPRGHATPIEVSKAVILVLFLSYIFLVLVTLFTLFTVLTQRNHVLRVYKT